VDENFANMIAPSKSILQNPYIYTDLTASSLSHEVWVRFLSLNYLL